MLSVICASLTLQPTIQTISDLFSQHFTKNSRERGWVHSGGGLVIHFSLSLYLIKKTLGAPRPPTLLPRLPRPPAPPAPPPPPRPPPPALPASLPVKTYQSNSNLFTIVLTLQPTIQTISSYVSSTYEKQPVLSPGVPSCKTPPPSKFIKIPKKTCPTHIRQVLRS